MYLFTSNNKLASLDEKQQTFNKINTLSTLNSTYIHLLNELILNIPSFLLTFILPSCLECIHTFIQCLSIANMYINEQV